MDWLDAFGQRTPSPSAGNAPMGGGTDLWPSAQIGTPGYPSPSAGNAGDHLLPWDYPGPTGSGQSGAFPASPGGVAAAGSTTWPVALPPGIQPQGGNRMTQGAQPTPAFNTQAALAHALQAWMQHRQGPPPGSQSQAGNMPTGQFSAGMDPARLRQLITNIGGIPGNSYGYAMGDPDPFNMAKIAAAWAPYGGIPPAASAAIPRGARQGGQVSAGGGWVPGGASPSLHDQQTAAPTWANQAPRSLMASPFAGWGGYTGWGG